MFTKQHAIKGRFESKHHSVGVMSMDGDPLLLYTRMGYSRVYEIYPNLKNT